MPSIASSSTPRPPPLPELTSVEQALAATRFSSWYPPLRRVSPKATIVDVTSLQPDFYDWLEEDGLMLPRGSGAGVVGGEEDPSDSEDGEEEDEDEEQEDDDVAPPIRARDFSRLDEHIRGIIEKYDGEVFPKMDWSAPRDAAWILPGQTLRCTTPADVYLLLKSSDFVAKDVEQAKELSKATDSSTTSFSSTHGDVSGALRPRPSSSWRLNLILKRHFASLNPSHEFRCFVRGGQFIAACQRDGSTFYDFLQPLSVKQEIRTKLRDFWVANLKDKLVLEDASDYDGEPATSLHNTQQSTAQPLRDYIWDVYLTRDRAKVFLVDVNAYLPRTDALLWEWEELERKANRSWVRSHGFDPEASLLDDTPADTNAEEEENSDSTTANGSALFGDGDQFSDEDGEEEEEERDPRGEPFVRIYTDGRPPTTHYQPWPEGSVTSHSNGGGSGTATSSDLTARRPPLPTLRLLTSQAQAQHSMGGAPTYVANMAPREAIDASNGGMQDFARAWRNTS